MSALNPYRDSGPWGAMDIGGRRLPGVIVSIDGAERPEEWEVQKPTEKSGATTIWKGTNIAQTIKVVVALATEAQFDEYIAVRTHLRPKLGTKPPAYPIVNPIVNFSEITRVSCRNVAPPKWVEKGAYWTGEITLIDFSPPKPANTGVPKVGAGEFSEDAPDPNAALKQQLAELLKEAKSL